MENLLWIGLLLALLIVLCFCAYNSKKSNNPNSDPDEYPDQVIDLGDPNEKLMPGEPLYA